MIVRAAEMILYSMKCSYGILVNLKSIQQEE